MALPESTRTEVLNYAKAHLPDENWHVNFFSFVGDQKLRRRLGNATNAQRASAALLRDIDALTRDREESVSHIARVRRDFERDCRASGAA